MPQTTPAAPLYRGPNRLGPYRINPNTPLNQLFRVLGRPARPAAGYFCYHNGGAYLWLEPKAHFPRLAGELLLSSFPNCRGESVVTTSVPIGTWRTPQGIGLGSRQATILRVYGLPAYRGSVQSNDPGINRTQPGLANPELGRPLQQWIYNSSGDLRGVKFGLAHGRVVFIFIGNNE